MYDGKARNILLKGGQDKGHYSELEALGRAIADGNYEKLIPLWQLVQATEISFEVEEKLKK